MDNKSGLYSLTYKEVEKLNPNVAILPWGATEAHNQHLPYTCDITEAYHVSEISATLANEKGARAVVLPAVPFGNNAAQLDQYCTIHLNTSTALAILKDVCSSLKKQGIERLLLVNSHGGNNFKPLIRDLQLEFDMLIVLADLFLMIPEKVEELFDNPGDHAGQLETSFYMAISDEVINSDNAGDGKRIPFDIKELNKKGIWTPRPWRASHPDLGSGSPKGADKQKGVKYVEELRNELSEVILSMSNATKGDIPYL